MGFRRFSSGSRTTVSGRPGMSSGGVSRPHNCMSPGCTRRGETERGYNREVTRPHNCMSPGCTRRGETETVEKMKARVEYDLEYLRNWSLVLDLQIIVRTIRVIFFDRNAY